MMPYFTISNWHGKQHCSKTIASDEDKRSMTFGREIERYPLTSGLAELSLASLLEMRNAGMLDN